jgi:hypothetical protein
MIAIAITIAIVASVAACQVLMRCIAFSAYRRMSGTPTHGPSQFCGQ